MTGAEGLVGSALMEELRDQGYENLSLLSRRFCDLTNLEQTISFFEKVHPQVVFHNAAAVYGIGGNQKHRGRVFLENVLINTNVIEASRLCKAKKVIAMGTVAAYPTPRTFPVKEDQIWEGPPHGSESSYGHAKRAMLAQLLAYKESYDLDFSYVISTNLYGKHDKFDPLYGHVIPSLIYKFHQAKKRGEEVVIWGDGTAARDFLYSKDMARALILIMNRFSGVLNVGTGERTKIKDVVEVLTQYHSMEDQVKWDRSKPNGRDYYEIDLSRINSLGYKAQFSIELGLKETLDWFASHCDKELLRI